MAVIQVDGKDLRYDLNPDPLRKDRLTGVFIHGSGGDRLDWKYQLNGLPDSINVIALDLPGHGRSQGPPAESIEAASQVVKQFIHNLGLERVMVVGCSLGSAIALHLALEGQSWLKGLGLVGAGARLRVLPAILDATLSAPEKAAAMVAHWALSQDADQSLKDELTQKMAQAPERLLHTDLSACNDFDALNRLKTESIKTPAWIIVGEDDKLTPVKYSKFLNDSIKNSRLDILPDAGHLAMIESPVEFNEKFKEFINWAAL